MSQSFTSEILDSGGINHYKIHLKAEVPPWDRVPTGLQPPGEDTNPLLTAHHVTSSPVFLFIFWNLVLECKWSTQGDYPRTIITAYYIAKSFESCENWSTDGPEAWVEVSSHGHTSAFMRVLLSIFSWNLRARMFMTDKEHYPRLSITSQYVARLSQSCERWSAVGKV